MIHRRWWHKNIIDKSNISIPICNTYLYSTKIPGLVDTHLAILDPKPHLYTFFTFKNPSGSFVAGIAKLGSACYGHLTELYGDNVGSYYRQESTRTSLNMYSSGFSDMDTAGVQLLIVIYSNSISLCEIRI